MSRSLWHTSGKKGSREQRVWSQAEEQAESWHGAPPSHSDGLHPPRHLPPLLHPSPSPPSFTLSSILHPLRPLPLLLHPYPPADPSRHFLLAKFISFLLHFADITTHPRTSQHPPPPLPLPLHYVIMIIAHRVWGNWIAYFALVALSHQFLSLCHLPIPPQSSAGADSAAWTLDQISP